MTSAPQRALDAFDSGSPLNETSIPVAGNERCVESSSGAVGLPAILKASCSAAVRNPLIIRTFRPVRARNLIAAMMSRSSTSRETPHRCASAQQSELTTSSRAGTLPVQREAVATNGTGKPLVRHRGDPHFNGRGPGPGAIRGRGPAEADSVEHVRARRALAAVEQPG